MPTILAYWDLEKGAEIRLDSYEAIVEKSDSCGGMAISRVWGFTKASFVEKNLSGMEVEAHINCVNHKPRKFAHLVRPLTIFSLPIRYRLHETLHFGSKGLGKHQNGSIHRPCSL
jgi:hypothetical protein